MKNIREIITDLNVARSNSCSKEKSEEIKGIINDLLPHEKQEKALEIIKNKKVDAQWLCDKNCECSEDYNKYSRRMTITQEEYDLLKEVLLCQK